MIHPITLYGAGVIVIVCTAVMATLFGISQDWLVAIASIIISTAVFIGGINFGILAYYLFKVFRGYDYKYEVQSSASGTLICFVIWVIGVFLMYYSKL